MAESLFRTTDRSRSKVKRQPSAQAYGKRIHTNIVLMLTCFVFTLYIYQAKPAPLSRESYPSGEVSRLGCNIRTIGRFPQLFLIPRCGSVKPIWYMTWYLCAVNAAADISPLNELSCYGSIETLSYVLCDPNTNGPSSLVIDIVLFRNDKTHDDLTSYLINYYVVILRVLELDHLYCALRDICFNILQYSEGLCYDPILDIRHGPYLRRIRTELLMDEYMTKRTHIVLISNVVANTYPQQLWMRRLPVVYIEVLDVTCNFLILVWYEVHVNSCSRSQSWASQLAICGRICYSNMSCIFTYHFLHHVRPVPYEGQVIYMSSIDIDTWMLMYENTDPSSFLIRYDSVSGFPIFDLSGTCFSILCENLTSSTSWLRCAPDVSSTNYASFIMTTSSIILNEYEVQVIYIINTYAKDRYKHNIDILYAIHRHIHKVVGMSHIISLHTWFPLEVNPRPSVVSVLVVKGCCILVYILILNVFVLFQFMRVGSSEWARLNLVEVYDTHIQHMDDLAQWSRQHTARRGLLTKYYKDDGSEYRLLIMCPNDIWTLSGNTISIGPAYADWLSYLWLYIRYMNMTYHIGATARIRQNQSKYGGHISRLRYTMVYTCDMFAMCVYFKLKSPKCKVELYCIFLSWRLS